MAEKGGKGHSLPGKAAKSSLKSTTPNGASAKGKDDGSGKPKKGRKVQFDSEGLGDGIFGFSSGTKADSLLKMSVSEFIIFGLFLWIYCLAVPCGFGCLRCVICYLLRADYFVLAICVFSLVNLGKGGKGDKTGSAAKSSAPKELPPLELRVEQELPKHAKCLMDCEAAEILQGIQEQMVVLSEDPTIKIPVSFTRGLQYAKNGIHYTDPGSVRRALEPLTQYGVTEGEICVIGNVCPETSDEVFALVPSLKSKKSKLAEPLKDVLAELVKLRKAT